MSTLYPSQVDTTITLPTVIDSNTSIRAEVVNRLRNAILATEGELGPRPSGIYGNVRNRLDALEKVITALNGNASVIINTPVFSLDLAGNLLAQNVIGIQGRPVSDTPPDYGMAYVWDSNQWLPSNPAGDVSGNYLAQTVVGLQGTPVLSTTLMDGYVLTYLSGAWKPYPSQGGGGGSVIFSNDISGNDFVQTVIGIQNTPISGTAPSTNNALVFDSAEWVPTQLTLDPELIGPAFAITLSGGTLVEVSQTVNSPSFTSTKNYSGTSALLTNNDNVESKNVLTEFNANTSFTSSNSYVKNTYGGAVLFTLTANKNAIVRTANTTYTWVQRVYFGLGTAGQSSEAFIEALSNNPLATSRARSFSITAGATDKIYYAYRTAYGAATFTVGGFAGGFTLVSTTISVTNANGFTENYTLYESDNVNLGSVTVVVS